MGDSEITVARNYQVGAAGRLAMDKLPLTGAYTTYAVAKGNPKLPDYVTDSAASGTGWATGVKTYNGAISVNAYGKPVATVLKQAKAAGYRTGNVTTAELQDATPAVLGAHVVSRDCKGSDAMATCPQSDLVNGGAGSIAEQLVETRAGPQVGAFCDGRSNALALLHKAKALYYRSVVIHTHKGVIDARESYRVNPLYGGRV